MEILDLVASRFRALSQWLFARADALGARWGLFILSFLDSFMFTPPPELPLAFMTIARPERWWFYGCIATAGALAGAVVGYVIALLFYESLGVHLITFLGYRDVFHKAADALSDNVFSTMLLVGITFPFIPFVYAAGFLKVSLFWFLFGTFLARSIRYGLTAYASSILGVRLLPVVNRILASSALFAMLSIGSLVFVVLVFYFLPDLWA